MTTSRRNNAANDVSGMLIVGGGCFFQVLEGPEDGVRATFQRIAADDRHSGVISLWDDAAEARLFAEWAMGWCQLPEDDRLSEQIILVNAGGRRLPTSRADAAPDDPANILLSVFLDSLGR